MKLISSFWTVVIISLAVSIIFLSYGFFHEYRPKVTQAGYNQAYADALETEENKMPQAKKRQQTAIKLVQDKSEAWNMYVATKTPTTSLATGGIDISEDPYKLSRDTWVFRDSIQKAVNAQLKKGGVKLLGDGPTIPTPTDINNVAGLLSSYYHYPGIKFPVLMFNLGQIQVQGTYKQIMDHIRSYKTMPNYLAMTDGLRLDGTAPELTGTYNLTIVGFIRGNKVFGSIPEESSGASTGGFGGPGGFGGRGGPPGGPGSFGRRPGGGPPGGAAGGRGKGSD
jgi:hypothetical protein